MSLYSAERALELIDWLVASRAILREKMLAHGSRYFIMTVLGHVTVAVHGGGRVPKDEGWYRIRPGQPYVINPGFCAAWIRVRQLSLRA
ncbi:MAG: hypothetical protein ABW026_07160 [Microvirga sp.]